MKFYYTKFSGYVCCKGWLKFLFLFFIYFPVSAQEPQLMLPIGHSAQIRSAEFSKDGKKALTIAADGTAKLWETASGKLLQDFTPAGDASITVVSDAKFSDDGKLVFISYENSSFNVFSTQTGKEVFDDAIYMQDGHSFEKFVTQFSPDGKYLRLYDKEYFHEAEGEPMDTTQIFDLNTNKLAFRLTKQKNYIDIGAYSRDGKKIVTVLADNIIKIWNGLTGALLKTIPGSNEVYISAQFSADNKSLLLVTSTGTIRVMDVLTGKKSKEISSPLSEQDIALNLFSPDGHYLVKLYGYHNESRFPDPDEFYSSNYYDTATLWDLQTGKKIYQQNDLNTRILNTDISFFSPDGKKIVIPEKGNIIRVRETSTGKILFELNGHVDEINAAQFSSDGKMILSSSADKTAKIWDAATGKLILNLKGHNAPVNSIRLSSDGKKIITASADRTAKIWDVSSGKELMVLTGHTNSILAARFSPDGKNIEFKTKEYIKTWNAETGKISMIPYIPENSLTNNEGFGKSSISSDSVYMLYWAVNIINVSEAGEDFMVTHEKELLQDVQFSPDSKKLIITYKNSRIKVYDLVNRKFIYTFIAVDSTGYLVSNEKYQYDGTEAARKLLHFTCDGEIIELNQVKDQLWVPNLWDRINKGDSINAKTISELNICKLTPLVENISKGDITHFKITPRRGGLGETVLMLNGIELKKYKPAELKKNAGFYDLILNKNDFKDLLIAGKENQLTVKAYTSDNLVVSRGGDVEVQGSARETTPPNLYAVMIGVSDYKGNELDLNYAAKDATKISDAISVTSKKLLNTDSINHVFMYNLTTEPIRYQLPEKKAVKSVFDSIALKAGANDIILIFFAGHGIMKEVGGKTQFFFLTADASSLTDASVLKDVAISMDELTDWIKPQKVKAQKRILIFDACNSGQAIKDFVKLGNGQQDFVAARNDDNAQQVKAIDKLNEKSGLFILSASASGKNAYELGRLSQGLLTYSLLKAIKLQPDILENGKYLNLSRWFSAAEKTVSEISSEIVGERQEPQIVANTNFNIGLVDEEVLSKIILPQEKPIITNCNFQNADEDIAADNLGLNKLIDRQLNVLSDNSNAGFSFVAGSNSTDAYTLSGRYTIKDSIISIRVIVRQKNEIVYRYEKESAKDKPAELADKVAAEASTWVGNKK
ncbi:MAG: hypothetical protein E6H07_15295 [Bacteroidetes bacterium]|nr:MAG: hypothetical protein E6H07_15295 [Bacteroidota bacterium]